MEIQASFVGVQENVKESNVWERLSLTPSYTHDVCSKATNVLPKKKILCVRNRSPEMIIKKTLFNDRNYKSDENAKRLSKKQRLQEACRRKKLSRRERNKNFKDFNDVANTYTYKSGAVFGQAASINLSTVKSDNSKKKIPSLRSDILKSNQFLQMPSENRILKWIHETQQVDFSDIESTHDSEKEYIMTYEKVESRNEFFEDNRSLTNDYSNKGEISEKNSLLKWSKEKPIAKNLEVKKKRKRRKRICMPKNYKTVKNFGSQERKNKRKFLFSGKELPIRRVKPQLDVQVVDGSICFREYKYNFRRLKHRKWHLMNNSTRNVCNNPEQYNNYNVDFILKKQTKLEVDNNEKLVNEADILQKLKVDLTPPKRQRLCTILNSQSKRKLSFDGDSKVITNGNIRGLKRMKLSNINALVDNLDGKSLSDYAVNK